MKARILLVACLGLASSYGEAQSVYLSIGGGYSNMTPVSISRFTYQNDVMPWPGRIEESTGQKSDVGFNIASDIEFRLPVTPISLTAGISYTQLYGKSDFVKVSTPPWSDAMYTIGELTTRTSIMTFRTGARWEIIRSSIIPYVSLELLYNIFGDTKLRIQDAYARTEGTVGGYSRVGIAVGGGLRVAVLPSIDASLGVDYSFNNLVSPDSGEEHKNMYSICAGLSFKAL